MDNEDSAIRLAAFAFLDKQVRLHGDVLPRSLLAQGFVYGDRRVPLVGPQGIFKPAVMREIPLSITTAPIVHGRDRPYEDEIGDGGLIVYKYRGTNPRHHENVGVRRAMETQTPLVYFYGVVPGHYLPVWPVFVVGDDPSTLSFTVAVDEPHALLETREHEAVVEARRAYITQLARRRLHQAGFRERVIAAYAQTCAVCRLRHRELLDAAHILPDIHPRSEPVIPNGMALCKLHHAAFDQSIIGVRPDLVVEVSTKVLEEINGPMLVHGLQGFHGSSINVPRRKDLRPRADLLEERYELFRSAG